MNRTDGLPRKGTRLRAAWDAAHRVWCGPDAGTGGDNCNASCQAWSPDRRELEAILKVADDWRVKELNEALAREQGRL